MTKGVRSDGETKSGSETVNEQIEKKVRKKSALHNAKVDPSLLDVTESGKEVLMAAEAQSVHKTEGHSVSPSGNRPLKGPFVEECEAQCEHILKTQEAREMGRWDSREAGSPSRLMTR